VGSPTTVAVPDKPGDGEIRYLSGEATKFSPAGPSRSRRPRRSPPRWPFRICVP